MNTTLAAAPERAEPRSGSGRAGGPRIDPVFLALVAAFLAYAAAFIWRTSFVIGGERYFSLFDDAMVSMRYARNLAQGHGLVWNPGERVEGITNPLWTLWMALLHLLAVAEPKIALAVQATSAALLTALLFVVRAIGLRLTGSRGAALGAVALTAAYLPLNNWALQGMEVGLLALVVSGAVLLALRDLERGRFPLAAYLLLGAGTLVRLDGAVPLLATCGFLALADRPRRARHLAVGIGVFAAFIGLQTGARLWYYGQALPNTYYLKMTGYPVLERITRGTWVLATVAWYANPLLFLLPLGILLFRRDRAVGLLFALVAGQAAYSAYVGGDAWEWWGGANRYLCVGMPLYFVLLAWALHGALAGTWARLAEGGRPLHPALRGWVWAAVLALAVLSFNALKGPRSLAEWALVRPPMHARDNARMVRTALWLRAHTRPGAVIAVRWAGAPPYFARRRAIDLLGKTDPVIARRGMVGPPTGPARWVGFWPGHLKWDYAYSIGRLRPDAVYNPMYDQELLDHLSGYHPVPADGDTVYVRDDSRAVAVR
jgi:arabinofuranosyltransferase